MLLQASAFCRYDVSIACGERVLLPAVRGADDETMIVADGFSCREQIAQETDREALHLSQVMQMALHASDASHQQRPEALMQEKRRREFRRAVIGTAALVACGGVLGAHLYRTFKRRNQTPLPERCESTT